MSKAGHAGWAVMWLVSAVVDWYTGDTWFLPISLGLFVYEAWKFKEAT